MIRFLLKRWKLWSILSSLGLVIAVILVVYSRDAVAGSGEGRIFGKAGEVPDCEVALVLGCVQFLENGRENLYFKYRIEAVVELWKAGRVQQVLVSGDNSRKGYDEPTDMKAALVLAGLPEDRIHCDYAGLRTLDSVVRARDVFQLKRFVVVSQQFHVERALYIAREAGIDAYGYPARDLTGRGGLRTKAREELARVKAVLDMKLLNTQPKFLGDPVPILGASS